MADRMRVTALMGSTAKVEGPGTSNRLSRPVVAASRETAAEYTIRPVTNPRLPHAADTDDNLQTVATPSPAWPARKTATAPGEIDGSTWRERRASGCSRPRPTGASPHRGSGTPRHRRR